MRLPTNHILWIAKSGLGLFILVGLRVQLLKLLLQFLRCCQIRRFVRVLLPVRFASTMVLLGSGFLFLSHSRASYAQSPEIFKGLAYITYGSEVHRPCDGGCANTGHAGLTVYWEEDKEGVGPIFAVLDRQYVNYSAVTYTWTKGASCGGSGFLYTFSAQIESEGGCTGGLGQTVSQILHIGDFDQAAPPFGYSSLEEYMAWLKASAFCAVEPSIEASNFGDALDAFVASKPELANLPYDPTMSPPCGWAPGDGVSYGYEYLLPCQYAGGDCSGSPSLTWTEEPSHAAVCCNGCSDPGTCVAPQVWDVASCTCKEPGTTGGTEPSGGNGTNGGTGPGQRPNGGGLPGLPGNPGMPGLPPDPNNPNSGGGNGTEPGTEPGNGPLPGPGGTSGGQPPNNPPPCPPPAAGCRANQTWSGPPSCRCIDQNVGCLNCNPGPDGGTNGPDNSYPVETTEPPLGPGGTWTIPCDLLPQSFAFYVPQAFWRDEDKTWYYKHGVVQSPFPQDDTWQDGKVAWHRQGTWLNPDLVDWDAVGNIPYAGPGLSAPVVGDSKVTYEAAVYGTGGRTHPHLREYISHALSNETARTEQRDYMYPNNCGFIPYPKKGTDGGTFFFGKPPSLELQGPNRMNPLGSGAAADFLGNTLSGLADGLYLESESGTGIGLMRAAINQFFGRWQAGYSAASNSGSDSFWIVNIPVLMSSVPIDLRKGIPGSPQFIIPKANLVWVQWISSVFIYLWGVERVMSFWRSNPMSVNVGGLALGAVQRAVKKDSV